MKILKYVLRVIEEQTLNLPEEVHSLSLQMQHGVPTLWVAAEGLSGHPRTIRVVGTGWDIPEEAQAGQYLGTVQDDGGYVWHYFMDRRGE